MARKRSSLEDVSVTSGEEEETEPQAPISASKPALSESDSEHHHFTVEPKTPTMLCAHAPEIATSDQAPLDVPVQAPPPAQSSQAPEQHMPKNRLQELTQKLKLPLPIYESVREGLPHLPSYRSKVTVGERIFTSKNTFTTRKAAEKDAAQLAFNYLSQNYTEQDSTADFGLILENTMFCKSILNELAIKITRETVKYDTAKVEGLRNGFVSSFSFNGVTYTSINAQSKKEAEQLAARSAVQSLLDDSEVGKTLNGIIKSKIKLYGNVLKKGISFIADGSLGVNNAPSNDGAAQPKHDFKLPNIESSYDAAPANLPIEFVHPRPSMDRNIGASPKKLRQC